MGSETQNQSLVCGPFLVRLHVMAIPQSRLRGAARRPQLQTLAKSLNEAQRQGLQTAFLSHSSADIELAQGLQVVLREKGWRVYLDLVDGGRDIADASTAARIRNKIIEYRWFLFLATGHSTKSRWCPWEIGVADGKKPNASILIIATTDDNSSFYGSEYLQLYRRLEVTHDDDLALFEVNKNDNGTRIKQL